jgi:hypothetical protein
VTPKGTRPGDAPHSGASGTGAAGGVSASTRYTPPTTREELESPRWVPILMAVLIGLGAITIILRYLVWQDSNIPVLVGLLFLLGGLYTATKWH